jgi:hypothetical protein
MNDHSWVVHEVSKYRIYYLIKLKEISLFQDVWMRQILITVLYYNNFNTILIKHYTLMF